MSGIDEIMFTKNNAVCSKCGGHLSYKYSGIYECDSCHIEVYDDFGYVRKYLESHGPSTANQISQATGVSISSINRMLRIGRLEIPVGSDVYIQCEECGAPIRFGRCCEECSSRLITDGKKGFFIEEVGERVRGGSKRMHYLGSEEMEEKLVIGKKNRLNLNDEEPTIRSERRLQNLEEPTIRSGRRLQSLEEPTIRSGRNLQNLEEKTIRSNRRLDLSESSGIPRTGRRLKRED